LEQAIPKLDNSMVSSVSQNPGAPLLVVNGPLGEPVKNAEMTMLTGFPVWRHTWEFETMEERDFVGEYLRLALGFPPLNARLHRLILCAQLCGQLGEEVFQAYAAAIYEPGNRGMREIEDYAAGRAFR
jgi:hypothetical protein